MARPKKEKKYVTQVPTHIFWIPDILFWKCVHIKCLITSSKLYFWKILLHFLRKHNVANRSDKADFWVMCLVMSKNPMDQIMIKIYTCSHLHFFWEGLNWIRKPALSDQISPAVLLRNWSKISETNISEILYDILKIFSETSNYGVQV